MTRQLVSSNAPGERLASFSRAVRVGDAVYVAGTTATDETGTAQHPGDAVAQAGYVMQKVESALREAGATLADIARTRVFVHNVEDSEAVARVHGSVFADVRPANTLLRASRSTWRRWSRSRSMRWCRRVDDTVDAAPAGQRTRAWVGALGAAADGVKRWAIIDARNGARRRG